MSQTETRKRIRDMGPLERIDHAKQIRAEAKRRVALSAVRARETGETNG